MSELTNEELLARVRRMIDYECYGTRMFFDECEREGDLNSETRRRYQNAYNHLVILRQKMTPEYLATVKDWDGPEALNRIFIDDAGKELKDQECP